MASPAIFWWSQPSSASSAQILEPTPPLVPAPPEPKPTPPAPKPNPKKNPKSSSSSSAKKNPQRGLGVAQLERIRLQKIAGDEIHPFPVALTSIYEQEPLVAAAASCTMQGGGGSPFAYATGASSGAVCYVPEQYRVGCGYGGGPASAIRLVMHEQYAMDRVRIGSGSVVVQPPPPPPPELPSNQRPAPACIFDHCEFCLRKRILSEFSCGNGVDDYFVMDEMERRRSFGRERVIKEYEFFPHNSSTESNGGEGLGSGGEPAAAASPSATSPGASNFVDLSLKLF